MIFVTGGTGFIGYVNEAEDGITALLMYLADLGKEIKALKRSTSSTQFFTDLLSFYKKPELAAKVEWLEGDLDDAPGLIEFMKDCDTVYHCAGNVSFSEKDWDSLLAVNRNGTANVVNAALENGASKFCLFSSVAALDMSQGIKGKKTDWKVFRKTQPYGYSKYLSELEAYRGYEEGLKVLVLNPAVVVGPSEKNNSLSKFIARLDKGFKFYPTGSTGFVSVNHLCELAIDATDKLEDVQQITVCSENMKFRDFTTLFTKAGNFKSPTIPIQGFTLSLAFLGTRISNLLGIKTDLSLSGLRAISNEGGYTIDNMAKHFPNRQSVEEAVNQAVGFYKEY